MLHNAYRLLPEAIPYYISNRTAGMSQQHNETSMGRYHYQGSDDNLDVGSTSAGSLALDSLVNEYTTAKADSSVSGRCDIETESDIIAESGIGSEGQVDDLVWTYERQIKSRYLQ